MGTPLSGVVEEKVALIDLFDKWSLSFKMLEAWSTSITIPTRKSEEEKGQTQEVGLANAKDISRSRLGKAPAPEIHSDWPAGINTQCSSTSLAGCFLARAGPKLQRRGSGVYERTKPTNASSHSSRFVFITPLAKLCTAP